MEFLICNVAAVLLLFGSSFLETAAAADLRPCRIEVVDADGWPVPMVELRTNHAERLVSDNAGVIACDLPELKGRETWFEVIGHGYERPADGFGRRGVRLTPKPGETLRVDVTRTIIARRLGRITGAGLFAESEQLGDVPAAKESGVMGCDSIQLACHRDKLFWIWGDTSLAYVSLGLFQASGATTGLKPLKSLEPPLRLQLNLFVDEMGRPRNTAAIPGEGATWLTGLVSLPDESGAPRLVAVYYKVKPPMEGYQCGLCVWDEREELFKPLRTVWEKSEAEPKHPPLPRGHAVMFTDESGEKSVLFGDPLPTLRCPATFEEWQDPEQWKVLTPQETIVSAEGGESVKPHSGSIAYNDYRKRWVTVFMQGFGKPSVFGELWYAEADSPYGPWGPAVKVLSHQNYTFYNPRLHPELTPADSSVLLFEGTYTATFADRPPPTPRWDYNQVMYRLDLDDPKLTPARQPSEAKRP